VNDDDVKRIKRIIEATALGVTPEQIAKFDYDGEVGISDEELDFLQFAIDNFFLVDITQDTPAKIDQEDVDYLADFILPILYHVQSIGFDVIAPGAKSFGEVRAYIESLEDLVDFDGNGVIDSEEVSQIVARIRAFRELDIDTSDLDSADLDGDGDVDVFDIMEFLDHLSLYLFTDLTGDGLQNDLDYELVRELLDTVHKESVFSAEQLARADVTGDGRLNFDDMHLIAAYLDLNEDGNMDGDIDRDGVLDEHDLSLIRDFAYRDAADLNGDQVVDINDVIILLSHLNSESNRLMGSDTFDNSDAERLGVTLISGIVDNSFTYVNDFEREGLYDIGLAVRSYLDIHPTNGVYEFQVFLDGEEQGLFTVPVDTEDFNYLEGTLRLEILTAGEHYIEFRSIADPADVDRGIQMQISQAIFDSAADINKNGIVDSVDLEIMNDIGNRYVQEARADVNGVGGVDGDDITEINAAILTLEPEDNYWLHDLNSDGDLDDWITSWVNKWNTLPLVESEIVVALSAMNHLGQNANGLTSLMHIEDDFDDFSISNVIQVPDEWQLVNGQLVRSTLQDTQIAQIGFDNWTDFELSTQLQVRGSGSTTRSAGVVFRAQGDNYYVAKIERVGGTTDKLRLLRIANGSVAEDLGMVIIDEAVAGDPMYELSVQMTGDRIDVTVIDMDGIQHVIGGITNAIYTEGHLGYYTEKTNAAFDEFNLSEVAVDLAQIDQAGILDRDLDADGDIDSHDYAILDLLMVLAQQDVNDGQAPTGIIADRNILIQIGNADVNADGVIDQRDITAVEDVQSRSTYLANADVDGDQMVNLVDEESIYSALTNLPNVDGNMVTDELDAQLIRTMALMTLFKTLLPQDLDRDGVVGDADAEILRTALNDMYVELAVSSYEQAIYDVNNDGVINFLDIRRILDANRFYAVSDLNGDGVVNEMDIERLTGQLETIYSAPILTSEALGYADIVKDGAVFIDQDDIDALRHALRYYEDITWDGVVDEEDLALIDRIVDFQAGTHPDYDPDPLANVAMSAAEVVQVLRRLDHLVYVDEGVRRTVEDDFLDDFNTPTDVWNSMDANWQVFGSTFVSDGNASDQLIDLNPLHPPHRPM